MYLRFDVLEHFQRLNIAVYWGNRREVSIWFNNSIITMNIYLLKIKSVGNFNFLKTLKASKEFQPIDILTH